MPVFENARGTRLEINLPQTEWPELRDAVDAYASLTKELRATRARTSSLEADRLKAERAATLALKDAIREGKGEKEAAAKADKRLKEIDSELAACERRLLALEEAIDDASTDIVYAVHEHREEWLDQLAPQLEHALSEYRAAVEVVAERRTAVSRLYALRGWVRGFPEDVVSFKVGTGMVPKLKNQNGAPYYMTDVLAALREDATPEPPAQIQPFQPLLPRAFSGTEGGVNVPDA